MTFNVKTRVDVRISWSWASLCEVSDTCTKTEWQEPEDRLAVAPIYPARPQVSSRSWSRMHYTTAFALPGDEGRTQPAIP